MELFGINPGEGLVLLLISALVLGPKQLGSLLRKARTLRSSIALHSQQARERFQAEASGYFPDKAASGTGTESTVTDILTQLNPSNTADFSQLNTAEIGVNQVPRELVNPRAYIREQVELEFKHWLATIEDINQQNERKTHG